MDHNFDQARNMKLIWMAFEKLAGLKINFHKSEIFCFSEAKDHELQYTNNYLDVKKGSYPFRYLGIPMHYRKMNNKNGKLANVHVVKCWKGKYLSGGILVLINSVLTSLLMFVLSFFEVPKGVLKKIDYFRSRFFCNMIVKRKKYRLTKWNIMCHPKDQGGLGIQNIEDNK
jgi:hypothetical protein